MSEPSDEGIEQVYREHGQRLWRAVLAYSGNREIADDAVSEAFVQAMRHQGELRSPVAWLYQASFRIAAGELKDRLRHSGNLPETSYVMPESSGEIIRAIATLPPKQRACILLRLYAGFSSRETASMIGSTTAGVRVNLSIGRKKLREVLEADDV